MVRVFLFFIFYKKRMPKIAVPVLWDQSNNFLNNTIVSVDASSKVVGVVNKPTKVFPPNAIPVFQSALQVKAQEHNTLYINLTMASYEAAIQAASKSAAPAVITKFYTITGTQSNITDTALANATIVAVEKNGTNINFTGLYNPAGIITISLVNTDVVGVIYYTN